MSQVAHRLRLRSPLRVAPAVLAGGMALFVPAGSGALGIGTQVLHAQQVGDCQLMDTFRTIRSQEVSPGVSIVWISRPDLRCPNGLRIRSDSAVVYEQQGRNVLIGNVRFTSQGRDLTARDADWYNREGRLFARGNVIFRDLSEGTEVRGDTLTYLDDQQGTRDELVTVWGGRPTAVLPTEGAEGAASDPYRVVANRLRFMGERYFWGDGEVEVDRGELTARADSLVYDRQSETLVLNRDAEVVRGDVSARGGNLNLTFVDGNLRQLVARRDGEIVTDDVALKGLEVRIALGPDESIETVLAEGGEDPATGTYLYAFMEAENLLLRGRRVELLDGEDGLRRLVATGNARGEALRRQFGGGESDAQTGPDEAAPPVEGAEEAGVMLDRDWIEGEEIVAVFEPVPEDERDPEGGEDQYRLLRLESRTGARALYRSPPEDAAPEAADPSDPEAADLPAPEPGEPREWPISYIQADLIVIHMADGDVTFLEAEGNVVGLQLEPQRGDRG
jgi:lipopolysaccharide export system protein LptA